MPSREVVRREARVACLLGLAGQYEHDEVERRGPALEEAAHLVLGLGLGLGLGLELELELGLGLGLELELGLGLGPALEEAAHRAQRHVRALV